MESKRALNFSCCTDPKKQNEEKCDICLLAEFKAVRYGEFIVKKYKSTETLRCHYFCLLSATCIHQTGTPFAGIAGFRIQDIIDSFHEFREKQCVYCCQRSAPIKCCRENCDRWFHYICGYKNECLTQFCGAHESFCDEHLPEEYENPPQTQYVECEICFEQLPLGTDANYNPVAILQTCRVDECPPGLMHRDCLQQFAFSAGYHFKCPSCLSKDFKKDAEQHGIFVPSREAAWENEPGAFKDLHKKSCKAGDCSLAATKAANDLSRTVGCSVCGGQLIVKVEDANTCLCEACMDETFIKLF
uniref:PHD-type domain-containing protein n=1 Tax=Anopheles atroparvus TaxID=41427 RepID=A0AAG5DA97_ANOAO